MYFFMPCRLLKVCCAGANHVDAGWRHSALLDSVRSCFARCQRNHTMSPFCP